MKTYEILDGMGEVRERIVADDVFVEAHYPGQWRVVDALLAPEPEQLRLLTRLQFRNRLSLQEKTAIYEAAAGSAMVRVWLDDLAVAEEINLDDPSTVEGVQALEAAGLLAEGRAAEILA